MRNSSERQTCAPALALCAAICTLVSLALFAGRASGDEPHGPVARAHLTRILLQSAHKGKPELKLQSIQLPLDLGTQPGKPGNGASDLKESGLKWPLEITLESSLKQFSVVDQNRKERHTKNGKLTLELKVQPGRDTLNFSVVDIRGTVYRHRLVTVVDAGWEETVSNSDNFLVAGPWVYFRSIEKSGQGLDASSAAGTFVGARMIYRRRLLRSITDQIPWDASAYADVSLSAGIPVSQTGRQQSAPFWIDARGTFQLFRWGRSRFEIGAGMTFFQPNLQGSEPGDLSGYFGLLFSGRVAVDLADWALLFIGANLAAPGSTVTDEITFISQPLELFGAFSFPLGGTHFLETRFRYFSITTSGTISTLGGFERSESFLGPELLWVYAF